MSPFLLIVSLYDQDLAKKLTHLVEIVGRVAVKAQEVAYRGVELDACSLATVEAAKIPPCSQPRHVS